MNQQFDWKMLKTIYHAFADDESREAYKHRLLYFLLGDEAEIGKMVWSSPLARALFDFPKVCFYGAGRNAERILKCDAERKIAFSIDTYKTGTLEGRPILSLDEFLSLPDCREYRIVVTAIDQKAQREIQDALDSRNLQYVLANLGTQYFDLPELDLRNEYFVDAGAFDGSTTKYFLDHFEKGFSYVFEANPKQSGVIRECLDGCPNWELFPLGVYDKNGTMRFTVSDSNPAGSKMTEDQGETVEVCSLDAVLSGRKVTFIKMDIEGSEWAALRGAERIIREQRPKLAVCVYHRPEDIWEIPALILQYHLDYKLYLRHYSIADTETVLYAV